MLRKLINVSNLGFTFFVRFPGSISPKTEQGRQRCAEAKTIHGKDTRAKRMQNAVSATKLLLLRDLGTRLGMFGDQPTGWAGRRPKLYQEGLEPEQLIQRIEKLESD